MGERRAIVRQNSLAEEEFRTEVASHEKLRGGKGNSTLGKKKNLAISTRKRAGNEEIQGTEPKNAEKKKEAYSATELPQDGLGESKKGRRPALGKTPPTSGPDHAKVQKDWN